jgi:hypothetical protein
MVKTIAAEGVTFMYVAGSDRQEGVSLARHHLPTIDVTFVTETLQRPDVRLAFFEWRFTSAPHGWMPQFLVWATQRDLNEIDSRVAQGTHGEDDFADSIKAEAQRHLTRCFECGASHPALVVDLGNPYPGAPELMGNKVRVFAGKRCPNCGHPLRQVVALLL